MPYIKKADRPRFDTMIDGLIAKVGGSDHMAMGRIAANLVLNALTPSAQTEPIAECVDEIVRAIAKRVRVRGDANYCLCRILLETLKPATGWSYHSLSDVVIALDAATNFVYDAQREQELEDTATAPALSVLYDATTEIERRLIGPYEDGAILKNGDMACFNEDFALKPLSEPDMRCACGHKVGPCGCKPKDKSFEPSDLPIFDAFDLSVMGGELPPITQSLTQEQYDAVDQERKANG